MPKYRVLDVSWVNSDTRKFHLRGKEFECDATQTIAKAIREGRIERIPEPIPQPETETSQPETETPKRKRKTEQQPETEGEKGGENG